MMYKIIEYVIFWLTFLVIYNVDVFVFGIMLPALFDVAGVLLLVAVLSPIFLVLILFNLFGTMLLVRIVQFIYDRRTGE